MADYQQIKLTRSGVSAAIPTSGDLELGELALNYADGKLYFKNDSNNIEQLNSTYNNSGQKIFVNEQDNHIGLNTISPEFLLDLGGSSAHTNNTLRLNQNDDGTAIRIGGSTAGDITLLRVDNADGESNSAQNGFSLKYIGSGATNNDALSIFSDNQTGAAVQALTVLQDGKVGINTPTPSAELDVTGDVEVSGNLAISGNTVLGNATSDTTSISGGLTVDTDTLVVDESEDRVGINQPLPTEALDVEGNIVSSGTIDGAVITGTTLTDGTASISNGAITGATDIIATGNVISADPTEDTHLTTKSYVDQQMVRNITHVLKTDPSVINPVREGNSYVIPGLTTPSMTLRNDNPIMLIDSMISVGQETSNQTIVVWITYELNGSELWNSFNMPDPYADGVDNPAYGHSASNVYDLGEDINTIPIKQVLSLTAPAGTTIRFRANVTNFYVDGNENALYINRAENERVEAGLANRGRVTSMLLAEELY